MCGFAPVAIGLSALGSVSQANQARQAGQAANQAAQYNAQVSEAQAIDARQRGEINAAQIRNRTRQQIGRQTTALAGAGVDVGSGSALDIVSDTAAFGSLDEQTARSNAMREAYGFRTQAQQQRTQGVQAQQAGRNRATGTLLTGAARTFNLWDQMG